MSDPIGALSNILKGKKTANTAANSNFATPTYTLPNGGGTYGVGGLNQPLVQTPSVPTPQFTPQSAAETPMGPFMNTPSTAPSTGGYEVPAGVGVNTFNKNPASTGEVPSSGIDANSKIINDITNSNNSGLPLGSYGMEGGYQGDMPASEALRIEMLKDRAQGTGLYSIPKGQYASYDQIMGVRAMADKHYTDMINSSSEAEKNSAAANKTKTNTSLSDMSSSPWLEGLRVAVGMQGGTKDEREENLAYMLKLPEDRQKDLIRSTVYNKMSVGQQQKFDSYDEVTSGTQQIASMLPADIATNPYKYAAEKYSVFLGGKGTKGYQDFEAILGRVTAPIINNIYGAAVTGSELSRAQTFIPDLAIDSTQRVAEKLKNLAAFAEFAQDAALMRSIGQPKPNLDDYIKKYTGIVDGTNKSNTGGFAEEW